MPCPLCSSGELTELSSEIMLHLSGFANINFPGVLTFPQLMICLDCGFTSLTIPRTELLKLRESIAANP
jgi:hypothetical protein